MNLQKKYTKMQLLMYGFEISKDFCKQANEKMLNYSNSQIMIGEVL